MCDIEPILSRLAIKPRPNHVEHFIFLLWGCELFISVLSMSLPSYCAPQISYSRVQLSQATAHQNGVSYNAIYWVRLGLKGDMRHPIIVDIDILSAEIYCTIKLLKFNVCCTRIVPWYYWFANCISWNRKICWSGKCNFAYLSSAENRIRTFFAAVIKATASMLSQMFLNHVRNDQWRKTLFWSILPATALWPNDFHESSKVIIRASRAHIRSLQLSECLSKSILKAGRATEHIFNIFPSNKCDVFS